MPTLQELLAFCKQQIAFHEKKAASGFIKPEWAAKHLHSVEMMQAVITHLALSPPATDAAIEQSTLDQGDLFDLDPFKLDEIPAEFLKELKISKAETADAQIVALLRIAKRPLTISEIMIGLYRKFGEQHKRAALSSRLYRMTQAGIVTNAEDERGVYQLVEKAKPAD